MYLSLSLSLSLYLSSFLSFCWSGQVSSWPNQFCRVSVWSGRPEGFESSTTLRQGNTMQHIKYPKSFPHRESLSPESYKCSDLFWLFMQRRFSPTSHSLTKQHHQCKTEDTRLISGAAMTCWLTPYQKWSIVNTNTYTNPIPIPIPNQVQPWHAGGHHLRDGALHHQDRHQRWFLPGVMLLMMFMVMVFRNF